MRRMAEERCKGRKRSGCWMREEPHVCGRKRSAAPASSTPSLVGGGHSWPTDAKGAGRPEAWRQPGRQTERGGFRGFLSSPHDAAGHKTNAWKHWRKGTSDQARGWEAKLLGALQAIQPALSYLWGSGRGDLHTLKHGSCPREQKRGGNPRKDRGTALIGELGESANDALALIAK